MDNFQLSYNPYKLLKDYLNENNQITLSDSNLFEAGFGFIAYVFEFYNKYQFKEYTGIECSTEGSIQTFFSERIINPEEQINFDSLSTMYERFQRFQNLDSLQRDLSRNKFDSIFHFVFKITIKDYILQNPKMLKLFHIGIFNKILHLDTKENALNSVKWFQENSCKNALMLITLNILNKDVYQANYNNLELKQHEYNQDDIKKLINAAKGKLIKQEFIDDYFLSILIMTNA